MKNVMGISLQILSEMLEALPAKKKSMFFPTCWTVFPCWEPLEMAAGLGIFWVLRVARAVQGIVDICPSFLSKAPS